MRWRYTIALLHNRYMQCLIKNRSLFAIFKQPFWTGSPILRSCRVSRNLIRAFRLSNWSMGKCISFLTGCHQSHSETLCFKRQSYKEWLLKHVLVCCDWPLKIEIIKQIKKRVPLQPYRSDSGACRLKGAGWQVVQMPAGRVLLRYSEKRAEQCSTA